MECMNFFRHSVDSAVSLRSQHHDRIRWPTKARYSQRRSVSELELASRQPAPPRTHDLEYLDNPAENLEFAQRRLQSPPSRPQRPRVEDDYYRHLTARAQDRWWHGSQGILQAPAALQAALPLPGLRRSRSLAVIREEACSGPLIPRARLVDKPLYKERFLPRSKFQTKEEALERIYNHSSSNGYGNISDNPNHASEGLTASDEGIYHEANVQNHNGWTNGVVVSSYETHTDNTYSRNPSEIDSLDSNYIHKNYNFDAHHQVAYEESSADTTDHDIGSNVRIPNAKPLFIRSNEKDSPNDYYSAGYAETGKSDTDNSSANSVRDVAKSQTNFHVLEQSNSEYNDRESSACSSLRRNQNCGRGRSDVSEYDSGKSIEHTNSHNDRDNISVTSYVSVAHSSPEPSSRRLENLAYSLAEKIDEYCESFVEIPLHLHSANNSFNSKSFDDLNGIYTQVNKIKPSVVQVEPKFKYKNTLDRYQKNCNPADVQFHKYRDKSNGEGNLKTRSLYRQGSSSKNITTEPFVTTLIENQYYSLPDINISKSLRRSEKIDEKLRQSDDSEDTTYLKRLDISDDTSSDENTPELKEINVIEVKGDEESLTQQDRKLEEDELQIHKEIHGVRETRHECQVDKSNEDITENIKEPVNDIIVENNTENEKTLKVPPESPSDIDISEEDRKTYFTNKVADLKHKFFKDCDNKELSNLPLIPNNYRKEFEAKNKDIKQSVANENEIVLTKTKLNPVNKPKTSITKHYSLRQRDPKAHNSPNISPPIEEATPEDKRTVPTNRGCLTTSISSGQTHSEAIYDIVYRENKQIHRVHSFRSKTNSSFHNNLLRDENNITILPLSGHRTIVVDGPIKSGSHHFSNVPTYDSSNISQLTYSQQQLTTKSDDDETKYADRVETEFKSPNKEENDCYHSEGEIDFTPNKRQGVPRVKKERSFRIAAVQNKFEKPPSRLIIRDKPLLKQLEMSRPQILTVTDTRKGDLHKSRMNGSATASNRENGIDKSVKSLTQQTFKPQIYNVTEKVDKVVKTDLEYQEKLHSVKNYWSKLIDKSGDEIEIESPTPEITFVENNIRECLPEEVDNGDNNVQSVENIVKSIETVKIVDSIKKNPAEADIVDVWKKIDEPEKEKAESEIEESSLKKIIYDSGKLIEKACNSIKETLNIAATESDPDEIVIKEDEDFKSFSPDIEIVELKGNDRKYHGDNDVTHATLIKTKSYDQDSGEFDHVRYKVLKSDLFRKSMIAANHKKEAQFDGLLQYLQDYSFQELLVNNNIVIIEPVRTKVETNREFDSTFKRPNNCRITNGTNKQGADPKNINKDIKYRKLKPGIKRHFFYHPIRVNKEIIEEELPNPDTVKTVRNLFESSLTMRRPDESSDPSLSQDSDTSKRSSSHKNLAEDKSSHRKKAMRYLTIDTSYGHRKWDSVSLSSGVSSGDLSSNNEHDYDTDALSPFPPTKENNENIYCSSSEEYLCESLNPSLCYESQYVSQDILEKIRECGTSITYYGGKVMDERTGPAVSPMTKQIMDEIRGLQRNCCRDCESCQSKCSGGKCDCLYNADITSGRSETASVIEDDRISKCCACSEIMEKNDRHQGDDGTFKRTNNSDNYLGFKFKLVKSNSCSSRLELAGTGDDNSNNKFKGNRNEKEDPPILYDSENSVKTKICRIESYRKGIAPSPFSDANKGKESKCEITINNQVHNLESVKQKNESIDKLNSKNVTVHNHRTLAEVHESAADKIKMARNKNVDLAFAVNTHVNRLTKSNDKTKVDSDATLPDKIDEEVHSTNDDNDDRVAMANGERKTETVTKEENKDVITAEQKTVAETIKCFSEPYSFEKKFYYINNDNILGSEKKSASKFGEMVFEEFEVLESSYDSVRNSKLEKK